MKKSISQENLDRALRQVAEMLAYLQSPPCSLIVCGGAALIATGLVQRTTKDVDIVAMYDTADCVACADPLPDQLVEVVAMVAGELGLETTWMNSGPCSLVNDCLPNQGLPIGLLSRLTTVSYGSQLTIHYISRLDQIHFKLYAAVDRGGPSYHLSDLQALNPTDSELLTAARWAMTQDPSPAFASTLHGMLRAIGYEDLADRL